MSDLDSAGERVADEGWGGGEGLCEGGGGPLGGVGGGVDCGHSVEGVEQGEEEQEEQEEVL